MKTLSDNFGRFALTTHPISKAKATRRIGLNVAAVLPAIAFLLAHHAHAQESCDAIYKIAMQIAQVKQESQFKQKVLEYFKSDEAYSSSGGANFGIPDIVSFGVQTADAEKKSQENLKKGEVDTWASLAYVNGNFGIPVLQLYNDCKFGTHAVEATFFYTPTKTSEGVEGVFMVRTKATGMHTKIKNIFPSPGLTLVNNTQLFKDADVDSSGAAASFSLAAGVNIAWVVVWTENGFTYAYANLAPPEEPTTPALQSKDQNRID